MCVLLIPNFGYQRSESRKGYWNQKNKRSKGIYSLVSKGEGGLTLCRWEVEGTNSLSVRLLALSPV